MENPDFDPRDIVTPYAFTVDEALLGTPLAAPWQRLVAFLIDLAIAGFIANVAGGLVSLVVVYVFYRVATRKEIAISWKRWARGCLVIIAGAVLFGITIALVEDAHEWGPSGPGLRALLPGVSPKTTELRESGDEDMDPEASGEQPERIEIQPDSATVPSVSNKRLAQIDSAEVRRQSTVLDRYARALVSRDSAVLDSLASPAQSIVAGDRISALESRLSSLSQQYYQVEDEKDRLQQQVQNPSVLRMARATANDFGITVGWVGLYFTLFLAWWGGRTPGKYLVGIRVVRLSGEPLSLWFAFERFGGYAAGIATGMLGFVQIYWDPNRQGIHDRVARTVVIRTGKE